MSRFAPGHQEHIEDYLGRPLTAEELVEVSDIEHMNRAQWAVAHELKERNVLFAVYVRAIVPISLDDAKQLQEKLSKSLV